MAGCQDFLSRPFIFNVPRELNKDKGAKHISWGFNFLFFAVVVGFSVGYGVTSFRACGQNLVNVDYYTADADNCVCKFNVGSSSTIGNLIVQNTTWYQQFNTYQPNFFYVRLPCFETLTCQIGAPNLYLFLTEIYGIQFTTVVTNITLHQFELYTGVFDEQSIIPLLPTTKNCIISSYNATYQYIFDGYSSAECLDYVQKNIDPNYNDVIEIDYESNAAYQQYCDLDYCQINKCSSVAALAVVIQISSIISFCFLILQAVIKTIYYFRISYVERVDTIQLSVKNYNSV